MSQLAYPGSDQQVRRALALPYVLYRGDVLRADGDTAGIRAVKTSVFEVDIGVSGSFGASSNAVDARRGMRELGTLVELGPRLKWNLGGGLDTPGGRWRVELPVRAVFDLSDGAAHRGWAFEPQLSFDRVAGADWRYGASLGAIVADTALARTFYEVTPGEATARRPAYAARSGLVAWRLSATVSRNLGPEWRVSGYARADSVAGAANESSPLVRRTVGGSVGLGLSYTWMRSERRASD